MFEEYDVQNNLDTLHQVVTEARERRQRGETSGAGAGAEDLWRADLQPRAAVRARTVPALERERDALRARLADVRPFVFPPACLNCKNPRRLIYSSLPPPLPFLFPPFNFFFILLRDRTAETYFCLVRVDVSWRRRMGSSDGRLRRTRRRRSGRMPGLRRSLRSLTRLVIVHHLFFVWVRSC